MAFLEDDRLTDTQRNFQIQGQLIFFESVKIGEKIPIFSVIEESHKSFRKEIGAIRERILEK